MNAQAGEARAGLGVVAARLGIVLLLLAADLWSKAAVFAWLDSRPDRLTIDPQEQCHYLHERIPLLGSPPGEAWLTFMRSRNKGMAWGFDKLPPYVLLGGRLLACLFLIWLVVRTSRQRRWFATALVLILAGALGNLYDNLFEPRPQNWPIGAVRDFIDVYFNGWGWHFPTFNVADSCISVGGVLLIISSFFAERPAKREPSPAQPGA